ncbi:type I pullulanase [Fundicoccus sp. Sow4_H7]|uniref:type I pullulanase n=1 Tax=Fundicoccus sp. Sow4_H7 TaxID=3438784 RepID=UPI003F91EAC8
MKRYSKLPDPTNELRQKQIKDALRLMTRDAVFVSRNYYTGNLGAIYTPEYTEFKLWAPTASQVEIMIYDGYYGSLKKTILMSRSADNRIFEKRIDGDQHGLTYRYRLTFLDSSVKMTVDPYAKAVTVNGHRSVVVDLKRTNPEGWGERMPAFEDKSKAIIYELHVRDFSVDDNGGISHRGKFLAFTEKGTKNKVGSPTGIDYLKKLGVTHVEFLPIFDYATVDETVEEPVEYNWGYDPYNFNAPEGSYSTNPYDPFLRITELKQMIKALHDAGIRVIMDVVYNHVYEVEHQSFHKTVPGYFYRYDEAGRLSNGTGVGNDTASERYMMRKYILDSVKYWVEEYHIDGFRFDLMGIHDITTMNEVRKTLDAIDPSILLFGEGWDLATALDSDKKASHNNASFMPRIGQFNDGLREALKGNDFDAKARGFINGAWYMEQKLAKNFMAGVDFGNYDDPKQLIQYVEAHDNYTLYDRLTAADPNLDKDTLIKRHEMATTIVLLSQGISFIHAGQEFLRTKNGVRDSYNSLDAINQIDWMRQETYRHSVELTRKLIALRQSEPLLTLSTYDEIKETMTLLRADYQIVAFEYKKDNQRLIVVFNAQNNRVNYPLDEGEYIVKLIDGTVHLDDHTVTPMINTIAIEPYTSIVLKQYLS